MNKARIFVPITKVDAATRTVSGRITEEVVDKANEICDYATSKSFFEKWSRGIEKASGGKSLGNVRVMHTAKVGGKVTDLIFLDDERAIDCVTECLDDDTWKILEAGGYTGFSLGGSYVKRWSDPDHEGVKRFTVDPVEISYVDNPCVPTATFELTKADGLVEHVAFTPWQPENTDVAKRATEMATAAGDPTKWADHLEPARRALEDEHAGVEKTAEEDDEEKDEEADSKEKKPAKDEKKDGEDGEEDEGEKIAPVDVSKLTNEELGIAQVWRATDGQTFSTKRECALHAGTLLAPPDPVAAALAKAQRALSGEEDQAPGDVEKFLAELEHWAQVAGQHDEVAEKAAVPTVRKGLYGVSRLAELLNQLRGVVMEAMREAKVEGDSSSVPGTLLEGLQTLGGGLIAMVQEEVAELTTELVAGVDMSPYGYWSAAAEVCKADAALVAKVGARNSKSDAAKIQQAHDHMVALGAACAEKSAAAPTDAEKLAGAGDEETEVTKALRAENERLQGQVEKAVEGINKLTADFEVFKRAPAAPAIKTNVVSKTDDNGTRGVAVDVGTIEGVIEKFGADAVADAMIRISQRQPIPMAHKGQ